MRKLIFAWVIMLLGFSALAQGTSNLLNNYISVKDALVKSDSKAASQAINILYQSLKNEADLVQKGELLKSIETLRNANNIERQRTAFNDVSSAMWGLVKSSDKINQSIYYQYCPMKKAYWLSYEKGIKNPYYGSSMLTCGKVAEAKN